MNNYDINLNFGQVAQPSMTLSLNYSQNQLNDYSIVIKMKMKQGIDVKIADAEFKERCKSCYTILTSFVKPIRDFFKPTFTLSYHVDNQYAYITFNFANQNDAQDFLAICTYIRETVERSQSSENVSIVAVTDLTFDQLSQSIANAIYHMNLQISAQAQFQKDTIKMMESLLGFKNQDMPEFLRKYPISQILTYLQMLQNGKIEINLDTLNYDIGIPQPNIELPFKFAIYGKLQKFSEQYVDDCIELEICGPGLGLHIKFQYQGSIFQLIDNILIIKQ